MSWTDDYRNSLEEQGSAWTDHVVKETAECACHPEKTWLRHVPTGVLMYHYGRSHEETLAHLADLLHGHKVITADEHAAAARAAGKTPPA